MPPWKRSPRRASTSSGTQRGDVVAPTRGSLSLRDEKILLTLVVQTQQINDRLTRLEDRFERSVRDAIEQPDQQDLLELRLHSARLAAELSRVTIELRAEINELASGLAGATGADDIAPERFTSRDARASSDVPAQEQPVAPSDADAGDPVIDLREGTERPRSTRNSGWQPTPPSRRAPGGD